MGRFFKKLLTTVIKYVMLKLREEIGLFCEKSYAYSDEMRQY